MSLDKKHDARTRNGFDETETFGRASRIPKVLSSRCAQRIQHCQYNTARPNRTVTTELRQLVAVVSSRLSVGSRRPRNFLHHSPHAKACGVRKHRAQISRWYRR